MKARDADLLIVPGYKNSGPDHWQSRWQSRLSTAWRVEQAAWSKPERDEWTATLAKAVNKCQKPVIVVAHSLGVATFVQAVRLFERPVAGALLVAPPEVDNRNIRPKHLMTFGPYLESSLPCNSIVVASRNDPFGSFDHAQKMAVIWGSQFVDAGESGHIDSASGHGPWPEGALLLSKFISGLNP